MPQPSEQFNAGAIHARRLAVRYLRKQIERVKRDSSDETPYAALELLNILDYLKKQNIRASHRIGGAGRK